MHWQLDSDRIGRIQRFQAECGCGFELGGQRLQYAAIMMCATAGAKPGPDPMHAPTVVLLGYQRFAWALAAWLWLDQSVAVSFCALDRANATSVVGHWL